MKNCIVRSFNVHTWAVIFSETFCSVAFPPEVFDLLRLLWCHLPRSLGMRLLLFPQTFENFVWSVSVSGTTPEVYFCHISAKCFLFPTNAKKHFTTESWTFAQTRLFSVADPDFFMFQNTSPMVVRTDRFHCYVTSLRTSLECQSTLTSKLMTMNSLTRFVPSCTVVFASASPERT